MISAVQDLDQKPVQELLVSSADNQTPETRLDRLWGISGGFHELVAVIIEMEAGCCGVIIYLAGGGRLWNRAFAGLWIVRRRGLAV